ncbi:MerR family DNA-binding transcriptional regulator [Thermobifida cellulosilytica]|uniref:MerR family transcriptional regulator n=1 Tax=Thermobifida cellulosilytica TB100 TaxID=665004 RepID=A0A147KJ17_THECS|nr:MerR family DNA-binding transcriptional regulator [Thermobifida cellulosilytica]KUP97253.1 MerR family transcriptional regulator [Thermobifida cellulosilytica TB100]
MSTRTSAQERRTSPPSSGAAESGSRLSSEKSPSTSPKGDLLSIGELAKRAGVSPRTIRYYEELGILPTPERTAGGSRRYPHEYIFYVEGALLLKEMGFSLEEIRDLGRWALDRTTAASERTQAILESKVAVLEHRIRVLTRLHDLVIEATRSRDRDDEITPELLRLLGEEAQSANLVAAGADRAGA